MQLLDDTQVTLVGTVVRRHRGAREDWSAGTLTVEHGIGPLSYVAGRILPEGRLRVTGTLVDDPPWGQQLRVDEVVVLADEQLWLQRSLLDLPGIGSGSVERLARSGADLQDLVGDVPAMRRVGLSAQRAEVIARWWAGLDEWTREFARALRTAGVPGPVRDRIVEHLRGEGAYGCWAEVEADLHGGTARVPFDPFALSRRREDRDTDAGEPLRVVDRFSPALADAIAEAMGIPPGAPSRAIALLVANLEDAAKGEGHTCVPLEQATRQFAENGLSPAEGEQLLERAVADGEIIDDNEWVYLRPLFEAEGAVAEAVASRLTLPPLDVPPPPSILSGEQKAAFREVFERGVSVVTGAPGRGKSLTVIAIATAATQIGLPVLLTATTGRAAQRLRELAIENGLPLEDEPGTVHRLLIGRRYPLPKVGLLIVEEASMLDIETAARAFANLPAGWRIALVGDVDQLPSVGPGSVLADVLSVLEGPVRSSRCA